MKNFFYHTEIEIKEDKVLPIFHGIYWKGHVPLRIALYSVYVKG